MSTRIGCTLILIGVFLSPAPAAHAEVEHHHFTLEIPAPEDSAGGLIAADLNDDGEMDLLVTVPGHIAAYTHEGDKLWVKETDVQVAGQSESQGLPGHHGPGVAAGDIDGDDQCEVVYFTRDSTLHVLDGASGEEEAAADPPVPDGAARWELAMSADFRGTGSDGDLLLQATNREGYRTGRFLAAYRTEDLLDGGEPMWTSDSFKSCAHNSARLADINGDGRDEVLGEIILDSDGEVVVRPDDFQGHMDSVFVADVQPDRPGLEVVLLEEGSNHVQLLDAEGVIWRKAREAAEGRGREPQNAAVGRFEEDSEEMFIWCRSRYTEHQEPFVFDAEGDVVFHYEMDDVSPEGWTDSGVEVIHTIDWTGRRQQLACAKERHTSGDVGLFEPLTGRFVERFDTEADRLYVADVAGDWREEVIVLAGNEVNIYRNAAANPRPDQPDLWEDRNYRRLKQVHNYYSP